MRREKHVLKVETSDEQGNPLWHRVYSDPMRMDVKGPDITVIWDGVEVEIADLVNVVLSSKDVEFMSGEFYLIPVPKTINVKFTNLNGS